jgi:hypothetical protein
MEGAAPIWFCKRGGCPLLLVAEGKKKIKGRGEVCEGCSGVCGSVGGLDYGGEKKKRKEREGCLQENRAEKLILCQL